LAGVADQLQTNYAADLRHILKTVFDAYCSQSDDDEDEDSQETMVAGAEDKQDDDEEEEGERYEAERGAGDGASDPSSGEDEIQTACACEGELARIDHELCYCKVCRLAPRGPFH
jgi:hypothetical protein